jgi:hypothetical protein
VVLPLPVDGGEDRGALDWEAPDPEPKDPDPSVATSVCWADDLACSVSYCSSKSR